MFFYTNNEIFHLRFFDFLRLILHVFYRSFSCVQIQQELSYTDLNTFYTSIYHQLTCCISTLALNLVNQIQQNKSQNLRKMQPRSIFASSLAERNNNNNNMSQLTDFRKKFGDLELQSDQLSYLFGNGNSIASANQIKNLSEADDESDSQQNILHIQSNSTKKNNQYSDKINELINQHLENGFDNGDRVGIQMFGGLKFKRVIDTNVSSSSMLMSEAAQPSNLKVAKIVKPMPTQWRLAEALIVQQNGAIYEILQGLAYKGCYICQGIGHCKTKCITWKRVSAIKTDLTKISLQRAVEWFEQYGEEMSDPTRWILYDLMMTTANSEGELINAKYGNSTVIRHIKVIDKIQQNVLAMHAELKNLQKRRCYYCDGYGHYHSEKFYPNKQPPQHKQKKRNLNEVFEQTEITCDTKLQLTKKIFPLQIANKIFNKVLAQHKTDVISIYKREYQQIKLTTGQAAREIRSVQDALGFYKGTAQVDLTEEEVSESDKEDQFKQCQQDLATSNQNIRMLMQDIKSASTGKQAVADLQKEIDIEEEIEEAKNQPKNKPGPENQLNFNMKVDELQNLILQLSRIKYYTFAEVQPRKVFNINNLPIIQGSGSGKSVRSLHKAFNLLFYEFKGIKWEDFQELNELKGFLSLGELTKKQKYHVHTLFADKVSCQKYMLLLVAYDSEVKNTDMKIEDITVQYLANFFPIVSSAQADQLNKFQINAVYQDFYTSGQFMIPENLAVKKKKKVKEPKRKKQSVIELLENQRVIQAQIEAEQQQKLQQNQNQQIVVVPPKEGQQENEGEQVSEGEEPEKDADGNIKMD